MKLSKEKPKTEEKKAEQEHECSIHQLELVTSMREKHMLSRDKWCEVWRCRGCKEMYTVKVKL
jgi:hypothetical protein